ncbi:MAG: hypothetical protein JXQ76_03745 [Campylobacterales bacterium]|nr:hypothetical protein [Campylobacterales bacterium]
MEHRIKLKFQRFGRYFQDMSIEQLFEYFALFGGVEESLTLDPALSIEENIDNNIFKNFAVFDALVAPTYIKKVPFRSFLISTSRSDGKIYNIFKRARVNEAIGKEIIAQLLELDIITIIESREAPLKTYPKQKIKKALKGYKIQPKIRFREPFYNFWFGFVEPFRSEITNGNYERFFEYFAKHSIRATSLVYEQLSNALIAQEFDTRSSGNYWDKESEFDILALSDDKKLILGECKYKNKKICKSELSKLEYKAALSKLTPDIWVLFSKNGFSNELLKSKNDNLRLYDLNDFKQFLHII